MSNIYRIEPLYKEFVWGGSKLREYFGLQKRLGMVGTVYHVIAIPGQLDNKVTETGQVLSEFYHNHRELFRCNRKDLPIRMTTTCNEGRQSYQLHPTDSYALEHDGEYGKVSGAVTLFEDSEIRRRKFGNVCRTREEFAQKLRLQAWEQLFGYVEQKNGDFLHTPAGVIHGGEGDGSITCTFSSNGDLTYRFFDYGRNDPKRPLEIDKVIECANIPEVPTAAVHVEPVNVDGVKIWEYHNVRGEYTARRIETSDAGVYERPNFYFLACVVGRGSVGHVELGLGETVLIPAGYGPVKLSGEMGLIEISYID